MLEFGFGRGLLALGDGRLGGRPGVAWRRRGLGGWGLEVIALKGRDWAVAKLSFRESSELLCDVVASVEAETGGWDSGEELDGYVAANADLPLSVRPDFSSSWRTQKDGGKKREGRGEDLLSQGEQW